MSGVVIDSSASPLTSILSSRLDQQIERLLHLISLIPVDKLEWSPTSSAFRLCDLLGHLLECLAGFCAVLYAIRPGDLAHFAELRNKTVNQPCPPDEAKQRISEYSERIHEGLSLITDSDLGLPVPTVFARGGEAVFSLLLANFEHLVNHKHQLFIYLKLLGVDVGSKDLYVFREIE